jgi:drug/metabolite transporter (DMT)-like permease
MQRRLRLNVNTGHSETKEILCPGALLKRVTVTAGGWSATLEAHGATVLFGLAGLFGKWIEAPALVVSGMRTLITGACFAALLGAWPRLGAPSTGAADGAAQDGPYPSSRWGNRVLAALAGGVLGVHWWCFFQAIQVSTVAVALLAYSTAPGFVAVLEPLIHRERPSGRALVASTVVLAGVALMVQRWTLGEATALGVAWGAAAGFLFAVLMLLNRRLVPVFGPVRLSYYLNLGASVVLLPFLPRVWVPLTPMDWGLLILLAVGFTVLAHTLFIGSLRRLKARTAAIISALEPVYGILGAALLLGEIPTPRTVAGGALILAAVTWVTWASARGETE